MKKMFTFLMAMVMLIVCVPAAFAAEIPVEEEASTEVAWMEEGGISPQSETTLLHSSKKVYPWTGAWAWYDAPTKGSTIGFAVQPVTGSANVTIRKTNKEGTQRGTIIVTATVQEGQYWDYMLKNASGGYYGIWIEDVNGTSCEAGVIVVQYVS